MFTLKCFKGTKHDGDYLIEVYSRNISEGECVSIKWCTECGAIVGDVEIDDHLMGREFNMKFPKLVNLRTMK